MDFVTAAERHDLETASELVHCNPFLPAWVQLERNLLRADFDPRVGDVHQQEEEQQREHPNLVRLGKLIERTAESLRERLDQVGRLNAKDQTHYRNLIYYVLYRRYRGDLDSLIQQATPVANRSWACFRRDFAHFLEHSAVDRGPDAGHVFSFCFQVRRAFNALFRCIIGSSGPSIRLRAEVWESIFTADSCWYMDSLYDRMHLINTLIVGPSGTGKELVARALAASQYIPFDPEQKRFVGDFSDGFHAVNLSVLAPTLFESELFGHAKGAFTGAARARLGWFARCAKHETLFLDEIGDLDLNIQVKLLRVLETRRYQRLGETTDIEFHGKLVSATNRNLAEETAAGRFRQDFYYRLCADIITTPSLREQVNDRPEDLDDLILLIARREIGEKHAGLLTEKVTRWISERLGPDYGWPGNIRELEQCVRNVMIRGTYSPMPIELKREDTISRGLLHAFARRLTLDALVREYCGVLYEKCDRNMREAARIAAIDWRTMKKRLEISDTGQRKTRRTKPR